MRPLGDVRIEILTEIDEYIDRDTGDCVLIDRRVNGVVQNGE